MALSHTILMLLTNCEMSGYDISKEFESCVGHYWQATPQQIYRELGKMEKAGWIVAEMVPQQGRPNKKLYSFTEDGQQELLKWMGEPSEPMAVREELLVKVRGGAAVSPRVIVGHLESRQKIHAAKLEQLLVIEQENYKDPDALEGSDLMMYLVMRCGIRYETMWLDWCHEAITRLEKQASVVQ